MISRPNQRKKSEYLVEDQPGLFIFLLGLGLAILAGLVFRSLLSPERLHDEVRKAAQKIHPSVQVEIGSVELSLSKAGIPRLALLIKDVKMNSSEVCWGRPNLEVDEISLPLSLSRWLKEEKLFKTVVAENVNLEMTQKLQGPCMSSLGEEKKKISEVTASAVVLVSEDKPKAIQGKDIEELQIKQLTIQSEQTGPWPLVFEKISVKEKSLDPRNIILTASSPLFKDPKDFDYSSKANLQIEYTEFPERKILTHLIGQFREGHFTIQMQNRIDEGLYSYEFDFKHLPLSKVFAVLHRYGIAGNINPRQSWLSLKARSHGVFQQQDQESFEIKDFKLEGDVGEIKTDLIEIEKFKPLSVKPFLMEARGLDIEKAMEFLNQKQQLNFLGNYGLFFGRIEFFSMNEFRLFGKHKGLEFIFSSRGQRKIQKVKELSLDASLKKNNLSILMNRFDVDEGQFDGEVNVQSNIAKKELQMSLFAGRISFNPEVQKLVSRQDLMGSFKADLNFKWQDGKVNKAAGKISSDLLTLENFKLSDPVIDVKNDKDSFLVSIKAKSFNVSKSLLEESFMKDVFPSDWVTSEGLGFEQLQSEFQFKDPSALSWKNAKAHLQGSAAFVQTKGFYDLEKIDGRLEIIEGSSKKSWDVKGTRDEPLISTSNP